MRKSENRPEEFAYYAESASAFADHEPAPRNCDLM